MPAPTSPPKTGIFLPAVLIIRLPITRLIISVATAEVTTLSSAGSWDGAVAIAIGGAGSCILFTILRTASSPTMVTRTALRTRGSSRS